MDLFSDDYGKDKEIYFIAKPYEEKFAKSRGYKLDDVKRGDQSIKKPNLPYCPDPKTLKHDRTHLQKIREKYPPRQYPGYSSMVIESQAELQRHLDYVHSVMQDHYVYGKIVNYLGRFPEFCCNLLSKNIFLSLLDSGYINSTIFGDHPDNHAYVGLPFLFNDEPGFILLDATAEQLWKNIKTPPRTTMILVKGTRWEYKTQWSDGNPLYPNQFLNLQIFRTTNRNLGRHYSRRMKYYFNKVFQNPVKVQI